MKNEKYSKQIKALSAKQNLLKRKMLTKWLDITLIKILV